MRRAGYERVIICFLLTLLTIDYCIYLPGIIIYVLSPAVNPGGVWAWLAGWLTTSTVRVRETAYEVGSLVAEQKRA